MEDKTVQFSDTREYVEKYVDLRKEKEALTERLSEINAVMDALVKNMVTHMHDLNIKTVKYDDLGSLTVKEPTPRPKYEKEVEEQVFDFIRTNGGEGCIKLAIHPATFSSFIKEKLASGTMIPDFIEVYYQPSVMYKKPGA